MTVRVCYYTSKMSHPQKHSHKTRQKPSNPMFTINLIDILLFTYSIHPCVPTLPVTPHPPRYLLCFINPNHTPSLINSCLFHFSHKKLPKISFISILLQYSVIRWLISVCIAAYPSSSLPHFCFLVCYPLLFLFKPSPYPQDLKLLLWESTYLPTFKNENILKYY